MSTRRRRRRVEPTDEWELLLPLFEWPEQESYEAIRPLVLFGDDVEYVAGTDRLREVKKPTLFETPYVLPQLRLFELDDKEWLKALKVGEYVLRRPRRPQALQEVLFFYTEAL